MTSTGPFPNDLTPIFSELTYPAAVAALARQLPDADAVVADDGRVTWPQLNAHVDAIAGMLHAAGLRPGDRVGVLLPNGLRWITATIGAQRAGLTAVPINTWYRSTELKHVAETAGLRMIVAERTIFGRDVLDDLTQAGLGEEHRPSADGHYRGVLFWPRDAAVPPAGTPEPAPISQVTGDALALILFTSGSTAMPKPVPLRHAPLLRNGREVAHRLRMRPEDRLWIATPMFFGFGCENALPAALSHGATLCIQERVEPEAALDMLERERCTVYYGLTTTTRALVAAPSFADRDLSHLRTGTLGFTPEDKKLALDALGIHQGASAYGLTESYGFAAMTDADDPLDVKLHTQGTPLSTTEVRVVDEQGTPCPPGATGKVELRGAVMDGYLDAPEANASVFTADGWFRTGDLASLDEDGRMTFVGRWKEMLKINGINIAPAEVERILITHPAVEEVFVVGYTDSTGNERMGSVVVPCRPGPHDELAAELTAHVRTAAASYKVPSRFVFLDRTAVPTTDTGKISRLKIARLFKEPQ
jgi:acyl-CoA synthetase (AMP-forming)/AMP-acid ligase II